VRKMVAVDVSYFSRGSPPLHSALIHTLLKFHSFIHVVGDDRSRAADSLLKQLRPSSSCCHGRPPSLGNKATCCASCHRITLVARSCRTRCLIAMNFFTSPQCLSLRRRRRQGRDVFVAVTSVMVLLLPLRSTKRAVRGFKTSSFTSTPDVPIQRSEYASSEMSCS